MLPNDKKSDRCSILRALNIFTYSYLAGIGPEADPLEQPHSSLRELIIEGGANGGGIEWLTGIKVGYGKWEVEGECPRDLSGIKKKLLSRKRRNERLWSKLS